MTTYFAPNILAKLDAAFAAGTKTPKIRLTAADGSSVLVYRAGPRSKWSGHAMVTDGGPYGSDTYFGRIDRETHRILYSRAPGAEAAAQAIVAWDRDPAGAARAYGVASGNCCFCGLELTDPRSNPHAGGAGYGPICAEKYGLPWGEIAPAPEPTPTPAANEDYEPPSAQEDFAAFEASFGDEPKPEGIWTHDRIPADALVDLIRAASREDAIKLMDDFITHHRGDRR